MQGFELRMLKQSTKILPTVKIIHTEVSIKETYENVNKYYVYKDFLLSMVLKLLMRQFPSIPIWAMYYL